MQQKNNTGAIFKNDFKEKDSHPDYRGKVIIDGAEKEIALWLNESKKGTKYFSVKIQEPYVKEVEVEVEEVEEVEEEEETQEGEQTSLVPDDDDGLPF